MAELTFYINGLLVPPPEGWQGIEIEVDFANNSPDATIKTSTFSWLGEDAKILNDWYQTGGFGGLGIFEGPALLITACNPPVTVFDGCIDMTSPETTFQCDIVKASVKETNRIQFLNDRASSFTFAYLASIGQITTANYVPVPYIISVVPDYLQVAILITTFIQLIKLVQDAFAELKNLAGELSAAYPAVGLIAWYAIQIAFYCVYIVFIVGLMMNVLLMTIDEIVQPVKYKYGMRVLDLFQKAVAYLNGNSTNPLTFSSTILQGLPSTIIPNSGWTVNPAPYNNLVIIPKKSAYFANASTPDPFLQTIFPSFSGNRKLRDDAQNSNAYGYYEGTFADLIRDMEEVFNAKIFIRKNILYFERWDFFNNQAAFVMPNQSSDAPFDDPFGTNASEISANYLVKYQQDSTDQNTYDQYEGTTCVATFAPVTIVNPRNVLLKGLTQRNINFALAKRKVDLTTPELVINAILDFTQTLYGILNTLFQVASLGIGSLPALPLPILNNRVGMMLLSSDFTAVPKLLVVDSQNHVDINNQRADSRGWTDAHYLAKQYHAASWLKDVTLQGVTIFPNQYLIYKDKEIPLCCQDFSVVSENNIITTFDNKFGRIDSMRWNVFLETCKVDYRVKGLYAVNIKESIIIDGN